MKYFTYFFIFHSFYIINAKKSEEITAPKYFALLEDMKDTYNVTWTNLKNLNERLNDHFRMTKKNRLSNAKR